MSEDQGGDSFDLCECVFSHEFAMRRLLNLVSFYSNLNEPRKTFFHKVGNEIFYCHIISFDMDRMFVLIMNVLTWSRLRASIRARIQATTLCL